MGQTRTLLLGAARPLQPSADVLSHTSGAAMEIEWACDLGTQSDLERIACSIAIERLRILTQPGP
jgi:hypothetical protein